MKNILFIVGSLRKGSFNHQLAEEAEKMLAGKANVSYLEYSQVPVFNQDLESPILPVLTEVREQILAGRLTRSCCLSHSLTVNWADN